MASIPSEIKNAREKLDNFEKTPFPKKIKRTKHFLSAFKDLDKYIMDHPYNTQVKEVVENLKKTSILQIIKEIQSYVFYGIDFSNWLNLMSVLIKEKKITNEVLNQVESSEISMSYISFLFKHTVGEKELNAIVSSLSLDRRDVNDAQNVVDEWCTMFESILKRSSSE